LSNDERDSNQTRQMLLAAVAAFCTYFCMYAFRKPFTAATYEGQEWFGYGLKTVLIVSQLLGYMLSKFVGIKVVSEMPGERRAVTIVGLIVVAELALVGFAFAPLSIKVIMLFLNGFPLGMVFGLVLAYLEGRRHTEALSAALCASFIISSGVVKSVGQTLLVNWNVSEFQMPMLTGLIFFPPLLVSVWLLQATPPPDRDDLRLRAERKTMNRAERRAFFSAYWPGLCLLVFVYVAITIIRTIRDDFGVEIWRDMGIVETPSIFTRSETMVGVIVTGLNALMILVAHNWKALRLTVAMMCGGFALVAGSTWLQAGGGISPFTFMVACGIGLYVPYVAFHTTVFERLIAASRHPSNLGFLMYLADAMGYLGYAGVMLVRASPGAPVEVLSFFHASLYIVSGASIAGLLAALVYFHKALGRETAVPLEASPVPLD
jgi:hypothetical protein